MRIRRIDVYSANWYLPGVEDMLRYALAFVNSGGRNRLARTVFRTRHGDLGGRLTEDRWRSFGIGPQPADPEEAARIIESMHRSPHDWITYRHPANGNQDHTQCKLV